MNEINELKKEIIELKDRIKNLENEVLRLKNRNAGRKKKVFKDSDIELIKLYRIQGLSIRNISKMFNCSTTVINNIIKNLNYE